MSRMMVFAIVLWIVLGVGCGSAVRQYARDLQDDQPLINGDDRAIGYLSWQRRGVSWIAWLEWLDKEGNLIAESRKVVDKSTDYLKRVGAWQEPESVSVTEPRFSDPLLGPGDYLGHTNVKIIVCLKPIVVVYGPGPIVHVERADPSIIPGQADRGHILLRYGYGYGTQVPYSPEPRWFSPDMGVGPTIAEPLPDDRRCIPVPWGILIMTRSGNQWVVSGYSKDP